jgi:hypothetical protein
VPCLHYCLADEIRHMFSPDEVLSLAKLRIYGRYFLHLKKLTRTKVNVDIPAIEHDGPADVDLAARATIILLSFFTKIFAFIKHCYGHRSLDPSPANHSSSADRISLNPRDM